jgi:hypothetical protein
MNSSYVIQQEWPARQALSATLKEVIEAKSTHPENKTSSFDLMAYFPVYPNRVGLFVSYEFPLCGKSLETPLTVSLICRRNTEYYFLQANSVSRTCDLRKRQVALKPLCITPVLYYTEMLYIINCTY